MTDQQNVLFLVFVGFFILIGVSSLLVLLGVIKTADPRFVRWAITGFVAAVASSVVGLFKLLFLTPGALFVVLLPPPDVPPPGPDLRTATLVYQESGKTRPVDVTLGQGGWLAKLPHETLDQAVLLLVQDAEGKEWVVSPFYPNYTYKQIRPGRTSDSTPNADARPTAAGLLLAAAPTVVIARPQPPPPPRKIRFDNYARKTRVRLGGKTFYEWRLFVDEPKAVLDTILEVEYLLHPTFPEPLQVTRNPNQFELRGSGWGGFRVRTTVRFRDGCEVKGSYFLDLDKPWPRDP